MGIASTETLASPRSKAGSDLSVPTGALHWRYHICITFVGTWSENASYHQTVYAFCGRVSMHTIPTSSQDRHAAQVLKVGKVWILWCPCSPHAWWWRGSRELAQHERACVRISMLISQLTLLACMRREIDMEKYQFQRLWSSPLPRWREVYPRWRAGGFKMAGGTAAPMKSN